MKNNSIKINIKIIYNRNIIYMEFYNNLYLDFFVIYIANYINNISKKKYPN